MQTIELSVHKRSVYEEVAKTTAYEGAKSLENTSYERFFTTDADRLMLERFWGECVTQATSFFKPHLASVSNMANGHGVHLDEDYNVSLSLSSAFETSLRASINQSLYTFFVNSIIASWLSFSAIENAKKYALQATVAMDEIHKMIYYRKRPKRIPPQ